MTIYHACDVYCGHLSGAMHDIPESRAHIHRSWHPLRRPETIFMVPSFPLAVSATSRRRIEEVQHGKVLTIITVSLALFGSSSLQYCTCCLYVMFIFRKESVRQSSPLFQSAPVNPRIINFYCWPRLHPSAKQR